MKIFDNTAPASAAEGVSSFEKQPQHHDHDGTAPETFTDCSTDSDATEDSDGAFSSTASASDDVHGKQMKASKKKSVGFGDVRVHTHERILGDNPSVSSGVPVGMGNKIDSVHFHDLDTYEQDYKGSGGVAPNKPIQKLSAKEREEIIRRAGHSRGSIRNTQAGIRQIKKNSRAGAPPPRERKTYAAPAWIRFLSRHNKKKKPKKKPNPNRCV